MAAKRKSRAASKKKKKSPSRESPVSRKMLIGDVAAGYPEAIEIMLARGFHCIGCHVSPFETIEQGAYVHGISGAQLDAMMAEINSAVSRGKKKSRTK